MRILRKESFLKTIKSRQTQPATESESTGCDQPNVHQVVEPDHIIMPNETHSCSSLPSHFDSPVQPAIKTDADNFTCQTSDKHNSEWRWKRSATPTPTNSNKDNLTDQDSFLGRKLFQSFKNAIVPSLSLTFNLNRRRKISSQKEFLTWNLVAIFIINLIFSASSLADDRVGLAAWERPTGMPKIASLEVMCGTQHMEVHLEFDSPFHGLVASKGMYGHEGCVYVPPRSGQTQFVFTIHYDKCGTKPDNHGKFYENTVVVQYDEELIEAWDEAKRLRCEWFNDYEKTATKTSPMVISDLEIVELNFHGDNVDCWMEIQEGKGPWAPPLSGIVPLGSTLTMVIAVKDPTGEFDMRVKDCDASDGQSGNILALSDADGCVVRQKLMGKFSKVKLDDGRATVLTYAFLSAFKFPDMLNVHLRCTVEICRHGCPEHCSKLPSPPGSHVADVHGQFSDQEPIAVQSQISQKVVRPNSIEENNEGQSEGPEQIPRDKPDIHNMGPPQSSEEIQQRPNHNQGRPPLQRPPPQNQPPPQQQPPMRYPPQPYPPNLSQIMHPPPPPPPRYFGRGGPPPPSHLSVPPQSHLSVPPPPMMRQPQLQQQPPRKLIPPGLLRQRPDISILQQHNMPNMRHQLPNTGPPAPVFPSQIYKDELSQEQHQRQADRVQSLLMQPEHKSQEVRSNEGGGGIARQGEINRDTSEEADELRDILNDEIRAEKIVAPQPEESKEEEEEEEEPEIQNLKKASEELPARLLRQPSQPLALKGDPIEDDSLSAEKAAAARPIFPKGPRSLRQRRSVSGSSDTIGVQGSFSVVSQADLHFALNSSAPQSQQPAVLRGRMPSEDLVYGICMPRLGFGLIFFGLGVAVLVAILIASFLAYAHYSIHHLQTAQAAQQQKRRGTTVGMGMSSPQQVLPFPVIIFKKMW